MNAWRELAADTARDPMLWFLLATGGLYALLGDIAEAMVLLASALPLVAMDFALHRRTRSSTQGLRSRLATVATVVRDGSAQEIPAEEIGAIIDRALGDMDDLGIRGKDATPYLLGRIVEITEGESLQANIALVEHNARLGAAIAREHAPG